MLSCTRCPATLQVRGLTKVPVFSEEEALRQFFLGEQARSTAQHALNAASSRSHVLFTLHIEMRASAEAEERALLSKLHLVDLAGERQPAAALPGIANGAPAAPAGAGAGAGAASPRQQPPTPLLLATQDMWMHAGPRAQNATIKQPC